MMLVKLLILLFLPLFSYSQLLTTQWNNGCYYNEYQPLDAAGVCGKCYVSSTAVAMGQVMKYWQHPNKGWGAMSFTPYLYGTQSANFEHEYLWSLMPNYISTQNQNIARLLSDCEVATTTNYSPYFYNYSCGLVNLDTVRIAMHDHFGYKNGHVIYRNSDTLFDAKVQNELTHGRPVIMEIYPFNNQCSKFCTVDGYNQSTGKYHINWGHGAGNNMWSGLNYISYFGTTWGLSVIALIGIEPDSMNVNIDIKYDMSLTNIPSSISINGLNYSLPNGSINLTLKKNWYSINTFTTQPWGNGNSVDALLVMKHYVGLATLTGMRFNCADVTSEHVINTLDALYISKRFAGITYGFPSGDWRFEEKVLNNNGNYIIFGRCYGDVN